MIRDQETLNILLDTIARFVRERLVPAENIVAETDRIPDDIVAEMKELGLFGLSIPEEHGGMGLTMEEEVLATFEIGHTSPCFRSLFATNNGIGGQGIVIDGTPEQKAHYLPRLVTGEFIGSFALGAGTLKDLSLALFVGMAVSTYSSIFVATPLEVALRDREERDENHSFNPQSIQTPSVSIVSGSSFSFGGMRPLVTASLIAGARAFTPSSVAMAAWQLLHRMWPSRGLANTGCTQARKNSKSSVGSFAGTYLSAGRA